MFDLLHLQMLILLVSYMQIMHVQSTHLRMDGIRLHLAILTDMLAQTMYLLVMKQPLHLHPAEKLPLTQQHYMFVLKQTQIHLSL